MKTKLQQWSNSQGIWIPKGIADSLGITVGTELNVEVSDDRSAITLTPSRDTQPVRDRYRIEDLIATSAPDPFDGEVDWGGSQGKEFWRLFLCGKPKALPMQTIKTWRILAPNARLKSSVC